MRTRADACAPASRARRWKSYGASWAMILPAMLFLLFFVIYPVINMGILSLFKGNATKPYKEFVGVDN